MKFLKKLTKFLCYKSIYVIDTIIPKRSSTIIFGNRGYNTNWEGNHLVFYRHLLTKNIDALIIKEKKVSNKINFSNTIKLFTSRIVIVHHGLDDLRYPFFNWNKRIVIVLWHGINLKGLSLTDFNYYHDKNMQKNIIKNSNYYNVVISTSKITKLSMISNFGILPEKVINTGYPRNDLLLREFDKLPEVCKQQLKRIKDIKGEKKLILYVPTFRDKEVDLYKFSNSQLKKISHLMTKNNCIFCFKGHNNSNFEILPFNNVLNYSFFDISEVQLLLRETEVLITDYSGIWFDFLLMDKPIIGFCYDYEKYEYERGFIYELHKIFPGRIANDFDELLDELDRTLMLENFDVNNTKYEFVKNLFHQYKDDKSSERVLEVIKKLANNEEIPRKYL